MASSEASLEAVAVSDTTGSIPGTVPAIVPAIVPAPRGVVAAATISRVALDPPAQKIDAAPLKPILNGLLKSGALSEWGDYTRPTDLEEIAEVLSITIKKDRTTKLITFMNMLLTYTYEDQTNIAFQQEGASGKSYIPIELSWYFPVEDVRKYASTSPTAFFHEWGTWDEAQKAMIVNLERKILIFLDQPHYMLLEKLRSLLSHDDKALIYKITDRSKSHALRTKTVIIIGFPTVLFCSAKFEMNEQEKTRLFLLSPETSEEKIMSSLELLAKRLGDRDAFNQMMAEDPKRIWLRERVKLLAKAGIRNVIIRDPEKVLGAFLERYPHLKPRTQRDFPRLIGLIKAHAMLNWLHRERADNDCIKANEEDVIAGFELYGEIARSNELGLAPALMGFYEKVLAPQQGGPGLDRTDVQKLYYRAFHRTISERTLTREILPALEAAGLISQEPDPEDRRRTIVSVSLLANSTGPPEGGKLSSF